MGTTAKWTHPGGELLPAIGSGLIEVVDNNKLDDTFKTGFSFYFEVTLHHIHDWVPIFAFAKIGSGRRRNWKLKDSHIYGFLKKDHHLGGTTAGIELNVGFVG